ncbi:MAG: C25 family cysteine peptidase, partial [Thermoplasmatota archaeon]
MRKFVVGVLISIVLIGGLQTIASKEAMNRSEQKAITFYQFQQVDEGSSLALAIKNADSTFIMHNHYIVPSRIEMFTFPYGTTIDAVSVIPSDIHELALAKPVQIAPPARLLDGSEDDAFTSYGSDAVSISGWYAYDVGSGMIDGVHSLIVKVQLFPVQYDPMNMNVRWTKSLTIDISYSVPEKVSTVSSDESYELIILTPSEFTNELEPLVSHKNNRDLPTKLITLSDIYDGVYFPTQGRDEPEKIKYFIKEAFEQWKIRYVMLVGGYDEFPTRYTNVYVDYGDGDDENFVSDLYYADILDEHGFCSWDSNDNDQFGEFDWGDGQLTDDIDIYPEVGLGRLACISESEVTNAVNKIITYETTESYKKDWFSTVLYCGGDTFPGDDESIDEGEYICDQISKFMSGFSANKLYVTQGTLRTTGDISDGLSEGSGFFILAGHGNPTSWSTHPHENENVWIPTSGFRSTNAASLRNNEKL